MSSMSSQDKQVYTVEDIYALPDGVRAELLDGEIHYLASPSGNHQEISGELSTEIRNHIRKNGGPCKVFEAPYAVFLTKDDKTYVEPDISVICDPGKREHRGCNGAPDWIIEIVSPSSQSMDYFTKLFHYAAAGVREYWIVDQEKNQIIVWDLSNRNFQQYTFADTVPSLLFDSFSFDFSALDLDP